ncbi:MAG: hypothetical protein HC892_13890 [Saprospiraceae bacterium]|nr:hypothetical protein [Saprospiraceae bacterium]
MPFLSHIHTFQAPFEYHQNELLAKFLSVPVLKAKERLYRKAFESSCISYRRSVLPDFAEHYGSKILYTSNEIPPIQDRNNVFKLESLAILRQLCQQALSASNLASDEVTHVITFTCTGLFAPGLEIKMLKELGLTSHVKRYAINFLGCYSGILAMRLAHELASLHPNAKILVFGIELCTLHFNPNEDKDYILGNTLFADGAVAFLMQSEKPNVPVCFESEQFTSYLEPNSESEMAWDLHQDSLLLRLSSYVPRILKSGVPALAYSMQQVGREVAAIDYWAIHPGGISILEAMQTGFGIEKDQLQSSYHVLDWYGNMSSVTILYVLNNLILNGLQNDKNIFCAAFGPGLSIETAFLKTHVSSSI